MDKKAWIVTVNMGYGHQRTSFPLRSLSPDGKVISANDYPGIPEKDRNIWETARKIYEFISGFKRIPLIGEAVFSIYNKVQEILSFYPKRDLSKSNLQLAQIYSMLRKGWGKHLIEELRKNPVPFVTTFFTTAFMAEYFDYPNDIYCIICDADISRTWASPNPKESRIKYFAPNRRVVERLKLYGIREENIFLTGYPLPLEDVGKEGTEISKEDLGHRIINLDVKKRFFKYYEPLVSKYLGSLPQSSNHILTMMFSVGGAGTQRDIGVKILKSMSSWLKEDRIKIILAVGVKGKIKKYFEDNIRKLGLEGKNVEIIFSEKIEDYFQKFNYALRKTDILWTKPSELSFYSALGLPIIIAPPVGSQEDFNRRWLLKSGFGLAQEDPNYVGQWLQDWLDLGYLAEAAMQGFIEGKKLGVLKIEEILGQK
jgi:hypothetical protein